MPINTTSRTSAEAIRGASIWFVPYGTSYGDNSQTASPENAPTFEQALAIGKRLGEVEEYKWTPEYKTVTRKGFSRELSRHSSRDIKYLQKIKLTFATPDIVPEAFALEHGLDAIPEANDSARPFSALGGRMAGWLYIEYKDGLRPMTTTAALAEIHMAGELTLADNPTHNDDLIRASYEFNIDYIPEDAFRNLAIPTQM